MGDLGAVRKPGQRIPRVYQDKQPQPGQTGQLAHESATKAGCPLMGTLVLMGTFISALLKATGVGKNRRKKRIWSREKSPAARANTRDGLLGLCWGIEYSVYFRRVEGAREGKEK